MTLIWIRLIANIKENYAIQNGYISKWCNIRGDWTKELVEENKISNQFMWSICEDTIIKNLLKNNNNTFKYMVQDESGEVEYGGKNFTLREKVIEDEVCYEWDWSNKTN